MHSFWVHPTASHLLIRHHEIALKGKNRPEFERRLMGVLARSIGKKRENVQMTSGRILIGIESQESASDWVLRISKISGVTGVAPCAVLESLDPEKVIQESANWFDKQLSIHGSQVKSFAVRSRRVNKRFPINSMELDQKVSEEIFRRHPHLKVNLKKPDLKMSVEVRTRHTIIYTDEKVGMKGLPLDNTQRVVCLLSGGIDSPVAAHEVMRRGCAPILVHFHSLPFTSQASIDKVKRLASVLRKHSPDSLELWLIPLLEIQKTVRDICHERYRTIHYRRFMLRIAQEIAQRRNAQAIVTGEALGQVASQTLTNIRVVGEPADLPVLRPLIACDKAHITEKAKALGTYEISIEPHDDTCVLFASERPSTQANLKVIHDDDENLKIFSLIFSALDQAERIFI